MYIIYTHIVLYDTCIYDVYIYIYMYVCIKIYYDIALRRLANLFEIFGESNHATFESPRSCLPPVEGDACAIYIYIYIYIYIHMDMYRYRYMYLDVYVYICIYIYIYMPCIHICIYVYVCTHT